MVVSVQCPRRNCTQPVEVRFESMLYRGKHAWWRVVAVGSCPTHHKSERKRGRHNWDTLPVVKQAREVLAITDKLEGR